MNVKWVLSVGLFFSIAFSGSSFAKGDEPQVLNSQQKTVLDATVVYLSKYPNERLKNCVAAQDVLAELLKATVGDASVGAVKLKRSSELFMRAMALNFALRGNLSEYESESELLALVGEMMAENPVGVKSLVVKESDACSLLIVKAVEDFMAEVDADSKASK